MKSSIPMPVVAAVIAVLILGVGFFLWKKTGDSPGNGDIKTITEQQVKSKEKADFTPEQGAGNTMMGGATKGGR